MRPTDRPVPSRLAAALLAAVCGAPLGGCAYFTPTPTLMPERAEAQVNADLPVPQGFELARDRTWRHERSAYRRLRLTYARQDYLSKERVVEFIKTNYPRQGWEVKFVYGLEEPRLILHKGIEECRVTVTEHGGTAPFTEFVVEVEPRQTPDGALVAGEQKQATTSIPAAPTRETNTSTSPFPPDTAEPGSSK
ncbi:MAG: hypothetical protein M9894_25240 [Planctomycetes bacterium]|nr:hypothetical protein [Planctomycetota bacterium]